MVIMVNNLYKTVNLIKSGVVPLYRDVGVHNKHFLRWIKLTLYFENPKISNVHLKFSPVFHELFETGLCVAGYGYFSDYVKTFAKLIKFERIITAQLGRQTVDGYNRSPLIKQHDYRHVTQKVLNDKLKNFIGSIEQSNPPMMYNQLSLIKKYNKQNHFFTYTNTDNFDEFDSDIENEIIDEMPSSESVRVRNCHSIEMLEFKDSMIRLRISSDSTFNCRSFIRDLGMELGCHAAIDTLHVTQIGPLTVNDALQKHELHYEQMMKSASHHSNTFKQYLISLRNENPDVKRNSRYI